jgi:hypothetical protein
VSQHALPRHTTRENEQMAAVLLPFETGTALQMFAINSTFIFANPITSVLQIMYEGTEV